MIKIEVTKGDVITHHEFEKDKDSIKFLEGLYFEKMNEITQNAVNKKYTESVMHTRNTSYPKGMGYSTNRNYDPCERWAKENSYKLSIKIEHL